jgi:effector-binding domain-containing protein
MLSEPEIVERGEQPYAGVGTAARDIGAAFPRLLAELAAGLERLGVTPTGPPFVRYVVIDMEADLQIELGMVVAESIPDGEGLIAGVIPAGRYASVIHTGHYDGLVDANAALQIWAEREGLRWAVLETPVGDRWDARLEIYLTDPQAEPDPARWRTEITYLLAEA